MDDTFLLDPTEHNLEPLPEETEAKPEATVSMKEFRALQKRLDDTDRRAREADENARYWSGRAQQAPPAPETKKEEAAADDLLEIISSGDQSRFKAAIKKMGFAPADEVDARINTARASARNETVLERDYPGLGDQNHPMFKATAAAYQDLIKTEPAMARNPNATMIAARLGAAELRAKGLDPHALDFDDDDDEPVTRTTTKAPARRTQAEPEAERVRRVSSQAGRRGVSPTSERDDELDKTQKDVIARFRAAGADSLTEESYRKRARNGVKMSGLPQGRRG